LINTEFLEDQRCLFSRQVYSTVNSEKVTTLLEFNVACRFIYHSNHLTIKAKGWHPVVSSALALLVSLFSCNLAVAGAPAVLVCIDVAGDLSTAGVSTVAEVLSVRPATFPDSIAIAICAMSVLYCCQRACLCCCW
jgi:hypothetical protein